MARVPDSFPLIRDLAPPKYNALPINAVPASTVLASQASAVHKIQAAGKRIPVLLAVQKGWEAAVVIQSQKDWCWW